MFKKLKNLFLTILLVLPMMFVLSACGEEGNTDNQPPTTQQPSNPGGNEPNKDSFKVYVDYNLPGKLESILTDTEVSSDVNNSYILPVFSGTNLDEYFEGWYYQSNNQKIDSTSIRGSKDETINIYANWKNNILDTYYTDGLTFLTDDDSDLATVVGYSGTRNTIVLPKIYSKNNKTYTVSSIGGRNSEFSRVKEVIVLGNSIDILDDAFQNSAIEKFDFSVVNSVGNFAFANSKLFEVNFSENLQIIGSNAFANCSELKKADLSNASSNFFILQNSLFENCSKLEDVKLSNNVLVLKQAVFKNCISLTDISFISHLMTIETEAFSGCRLISEISLPSTITSIGFDVFKGINNKIDLKLEKLYTDSHQYLSEIFGESIANIETISLVGNQIEIINQYYFANCTGLKSFVMSDSVLEVGQYAFSGCYELLNIEFSQNIVGDRFNSNAFVDTAFYKQNDELLVRNNIVLLAPRGLPEILEASDFKGANSIANEVFRNNNSIFKVTLSSSIEVIGNSAFEACENLSEVVFESGSALRSIGNMAFYRCSNLNKINLEICRSLTTILDFAFYRTGNIETLILPSSIEILGEACFAISNISAFEIDANNSYYATENGVLYEVDGGYAVSVFAYPIANKETIYKVPETVTKICLGAFAYSNLEYVYITSYIEFEEDSFLDSNTLILIETNDYSIPPNSNLDKKIYTLYDISRGDYTITDDGEILINISFDEGFNDYYFAYIVDVDSNYYVLFDVIDGQIFNIKNITESLADKI